MVRILSNVRAEYSRIAKAFEKYNKSMVFVSDRQSKPRGVWQRVINIEDDGRTYFYKTATLYGGSEKWVKVRNSEKVELIRD